MGLHVRQKLGNFSDGRKCPMKMTFSFDARPCNMVDTYDVSEDHSSSTLRVDE
jgi:hypothetical protein